MLSDPRAIETYLSGSAQDEFAEVRLAAMQELGWLEQLHPSTVAVAVKGLMDPDDAVAEAALELLVYLDQGVEAAIPVIEQQVGRDREHVSELTVLALMRLTLTPTDGVIGCLERMARDPRLAVRGAVAVALWKLGVRDKRVLGSLQECLAGKCGVARAGAAAVLFLESADEIDRC